MPLYLCHIPKHRCIHAEFVYCILIKYDQDQFPDQLGDLVLRDPEISSGN
jgi:hypothetical protein